MLKIFLPDRNQRANFIYHFKKKASLRRFFLGSLVAHKKIFDPKEDPNINQSQISDKEIRAGLAQDD